MCDDTRDMLLAAFLVGTVLAVLLAASVYLSGGTFGQRCAKAYPNDEAKQLWCVERLAREGR